MLLDWRASHEQRYAQLNKRQVSPPPAYGGDYTSPSRTATHTLEPVNQSWPSPNPSSTSADNEQTEQDVLDQSLEFIKRSPPPPPLSSVPPLPRSIAIPQVTKGRGQAFTRAWAPELYYHGISREAFLSFIDCLNVVSTANPPLQVLNLVGLIIGSVPYHWAHIAGFAIQAAAQLGTAAVSKGRTEMFLDKANAEFFAPRKLHVQIASSEAVTHVLHMPPGTPLVAPLTDETIDMSSQERRIAAIVPYASLLTLDVPPPAEQTTALAKVSAKQIERQGKKVEKKFLKERMKAQDANGKHKTKGEKDKEAKVATKLLWILIQNLD